ncbi:MAG: M3 family oligoendopeptidase [Firmicutes bacterium HGW-Firmicutes-2]|jgi:M3 family oligoendopeptidase|nr:MAG: M3 family oligoendopeptidase [Firmicutes bacterium HGW-Firmicutes-2]
MNFNDYEYKRIDLDEVKIAMDKQFAIMDEATSIDELDVAIKEVYRIRNEVETMSTIASIRFSINMKDEFYKAENDYQNSASPIMEGIVHKFYQKLVQSPMQMEIKARYGEHLINLATLAVKTFSDDIIKDLQEENRLITSYSVLVGNAKIDFRGKDYNLSTMAPFISDYDRATRIEAQKAVTRFFEDHETEFDDIYDKLVKLRHNIAIKLGYENYIQYGYDKLQRTDYGPLDVKKFRDQVYEHITPLRLELKKKQAKRIGLDHFYYYDAPLYFNTGNPKPAGDEAYMVEEAKKMYHELSPQTHDFFDYMIENNLMDLASRDGKRPGGYCTYMSDYKAPYIFANFNGTDHDVVVLTHEAGHAFQVFQSRGYEVSEYQFPTLEACEIHSMSMEYLTYPWMKHFFGEDHEKFIYDHSSKPIEFIPYGVAVDEFQHWVYEYPHATPDQRKQKWLEIDHKYRPEIDYEDNDFLKRGGYWFRQGHIFRVPFYYIDYTLALICAVQFYVKSTQDRKKAWDDYLNLCNQGGSQSFLRLLESADLDNPFYDGTVQKVIYKVWTLLNSIDDTKL